MDDDLLAEGDAEEEFHPGIAAGFPRKRVSAGALIRNPDGHILMVHPTYKPGWEIPGGVVEENEEPFATCGRELQEELGVRLAVGSLLVVDWVPQHGRWGDSLNFVFDGGILAPDQVAAFRLAPGEIGGVTFAPLEVIAQHVRPSKVRRLAAAVDAAAEGRLLYLKFGRR